MNEGKLICSIRQAQNFQQRMVRKLISQQLIGCSNTKEVGDIGNNEKKHREGVYYLGVGTKFSLPQHLPQITIGFFSRLSYFQSWFHISPSTSFKNFENFSVLFFPPFSFALSLLAEQHVSVLCFSLCPFIPPDLPYDIDNCFLVWTLGLISCIFPATISIGTL